MPTRPVAGLFLVMLGIGASARPGFGAAPAAGTAGPAAATRPAAAPAPAAVPQRVVKVVSSSTEAPRVPTGRGRDTGAGGADADRPDANAPAWLVVVPVEGGRVVRLNVADEFRRRFNALRLARGEWVTVTLAAGRANGRAGGAAALNAADTVASVVRFEGPRTLANPRAYVLDGFAQQKVGAQSFWTVKLSKFGQTKEALIPNRTAPGAQGGALAQPDAALVARLRSVAQGDVIEVDLAPGPGKNTLMLVDAGPAREPLLGDFVKLVTLKDPAGKAAAGIVIEAGGKEQTYAFPPAPAAAALQGLAKRLKPGQAVQFSLREVEGPTTTTAASQVAGAPATGAPATGASVLRDLRVDGRVEPTGEKSLEIFSTYVRVELSEARRFGGRFGGGPGFGGRGESRGPGSGGPQGGGSGNASAGAGGGNVDIRYHPGSNRPDDRALARGVDGVLNSEDETRRLGITPAQYKDLDAALRGPRDERPTGAESAQWAAAYQAWLAAADDEARRKVEQEMVWAAQGLSARYREDFRAAAGIIRSVLKPEQLAEVLRAGRDEASGGPGAPDGADDPAGSGRSQTPDRGGPTSAGTPR